MQSKLQKTIEVAFYTLFFFVPLILTPYNSELFEFNKMILTYVLTVIIVASWLSKSIIRKRFIFKKSFFDIPIALFIFSQFLSTITSIDIRTSLLGYYSRYHGGLASSISYALLYWAYVSNMDKKKTIKGLLILFLSSLLVSIYAVLEHFGIDKDVWIQDVQNRVFSTLGQPNWLAAWIVALLPITWVFTLSQNFTKDNKGNKEAYHNQAILFKTARKRWVWVSITTLLFLTLLYTKSRSAILAFGISWLIFWTASALVFKTKSSFVSKFVKKFILINAIYLSLILIEGTPWTPSLTELVKSSPPPSPPPKQEKVFKPPALEVGGTESGEIRKIVWKGAVDIWKNYPLLGTGVETFAYSYYNFRPNEHNLVSEWDFLYNKAHNEYLNYAATTGALGLATYLFLPLTFLVWVFINIKGKNKKISKNKKLILIGLSSGYSTIVVTNFFGFSVVPVALQFFLYPAFVFTLISKRRFEEDGEINIDSSQKLLLSIVAVLGTYFIFASLRYWYADYLYNKGKAYNEIGNYLTSNNYLTRATNISPKESLFWMELSESELIRALDLYDKGNEELSKDAARESISFSTKAVNLSPSNVNMLRKHANNFLQLSPIDPLYLAQAIDTIYKAVELAPTDAKLYYNLGLAYIRAGNLDKSKEILVKTVEMKPNYHNARLALALVFVDLGEPEKAREQLEYILTYINPEDKVAQRELEKLNEGQE